MSKIKQRKNIKAGIIGAGHIGGELYKKIKALGWDIEFVLKDDGIYKDLVRKIDDLKNYKNYLKDLDLVFLAIPTLDDGKIAFNYMRLCLKKGIPVVTCEKGSLSNYFSELEKWLDKIGFSASVGGGTRLLRYLKEIMNSDIEEVHAVLNGTLNYIFDEVSRGRSFQEAVKEAKKLGYAESGVKTSLEIINKEATDDIPMKSSILFNICGFGSKSIRAKDIKSHKISEFGLKKLIKELKIRRYIVSITKEDKNEDVIGGFKQRVGGWIISAGFKNIHKNILFSQLIPSGVNNSVLVYEGKKGIDGTYKLNGPGAGAGPTTSSMIKDAIDLLQI